MNENTTPTLIVRSTTTARDQEARSLAQAAGVECTFGDDGDRGDIEIVLAQSEVSIVHGASGRPWVLNLETIDTRQGAGNLSRKQPLPKAIGEEATSVFDATAGFGHDAAILACMGFDVDAWERSPLIHAVLQDAIIRATGEVGSLLNRHLTLTAGDAVTALSTVSPPPEVVYLDPMYPPGPKRSPLPRKPAQILRSIVGPDEDSKALLEASRAVATSRVVVKRPTWAPPLMGDCVHSHGGKLARYDVFLPRGDQRKT